MALINTLTNEYVGHVALGGMGLLRLTPVTLYNLEFR
jgi:hypothetical protein